MAAGGHFEKNFNEQKKVVYWSEMARNAIERDFQSSKMAAAAILWKKIVVYWSEMATNAIKKDQKYKKKWVFIWNGEKCDRKWFSVIQNGGRQPFCEQNI